MRLKTWFTGITLKIKNLRKIVLYVFIYNIYLYICNNWQGKFNDYWIFCFKKKGQRSNIDQCLNEIIILDIKRTKKNTNSIMERSETI